MTGELMFIGVGLSKHDISLRAISALKDCDIIFMELYTSVLSDDDIRDIEKMANKRIILLSRKEVEEKDILLREASDKRVAFLVVGDPMFATTHVSLRMEAEKKGIKTKLIPGISVYTVVPGLLGLQHYKFGRTTSLTFPQDNYFPLSPYYVIEENLERGLHTLILLDIDAENGRFMTINEGIDILLEMEERAGDGILNENTLMCGVARAGAEDFKIKAAPAKYLKTYDFGKPPHTLVIPGDLHFIEREALEIFCGYDKISTP